MKNPQVIRKCSGACVTRRISSKKLQPGSESMPSLSIVANLLFNFGLGEMQIIIRNCSQSDDHDFQSSDQFEVETTRCSLDRCNDLPTDTSPDSTMPTIELTVGSNEPEMLNSSIDTSEKELQGPGDYLCHSCFDVFGKQGRILVPKAVEASLGSVLPAQMASCWNSPQTLRRCATPCATTTALNLDPSLGFSLSAAPAQSMIFSLIGLDSLSIVLRNCSGVDESFPSLIGQFQNAPQVCAGSEDLGLESNVSVCLCKDDSCNSVSADVVIPEPAAIFETPLSSTDTQPAEQSDVLSSFETGRRKRWQCLDGVSCTPCRVGECILDISAWDTEQECNSNCPENPSCWFCSPERGSCDGALAFPCTSAPSDPIQGPFESEMKCLDVCEGGPVAELVGEDQSNQTITAPESPVVEKAEEDESNVTITLAPESPPPRPICPAGKILFSVTEEEMQFDGRLKMDSPEECILLCYADPKCHKVAISSKRGFGKYFCSFGRDASDNSCNVNSDNLVTSFTMRKYAIINCLSCEKESEEAQEDDEASQEGGAAKGEAGSKLLENNGVRESNIASDDIEIQAMIDSDVIIAEKESSDKEISDSGLGGISNATSNETIADFELEGTFTAELNETITVVQVNVNTSITEQEDFENVVKDVAPGPTRLAPLDVCDGPVDFIVVEVDSATATTIEYQTETAVFSVAECAFLCSVDPECTEAAVMPSGAGSETMMCFLGRIGENSTISCVGALSNEPRITEHPGDQPIRIGCFGCAAELLNDVIVIPSIVNASFQLDNEVNTIEITEDHAVNASLIDSESSLVCNGSTSFVLKEDNATTAETIQFLTKTEVFSVAECAFLCYADPECTEAAAMAPDGSADQIVCFLGMSGEGAPMDCEDVEDQPKLIDHPGNQTIRIGCFKCGA